MATYNGKCFCGAVQIEVTAEPQGMGVTTMGQNQTLRARHESDV